MGNKNTPYIQSGSLQFIRYGDTRVRVDEGVVERRHRNAVDASLLFSLSEVTKHILLSF